MIFFLNKIKKRCKGPVKWGIKPLFAGGTSKIIKKRPTEKKRKRFLDPFKRLLEMKKALVIWGLYKGKII